MTSADTADAHRPLRRRSEPPTSAARSRSAAGSPAAASTASTWPSSTCATTPASSSASIDGAADVRSEYVVRVVGTVRARPEGTDNANLATGEVEVGDVRGRDPQRRRAAAVPARRRASRSTRWSASRHRYVDLRADRMQRNLRVRAKVNGALRRAMDDQGFVEVETPMLIASTPEGARDFVVPRRLLAGRVLRAAPEPAAVQAAAAWSAASTATTRSPAASATRTSAPTASSSSCSSTPRPASPRQDDVLAFISDRRVRRASRP